MLVRTASRGGVEHHLRAPRPEDRLNRRRVTQVGQDHRRAVEQRAVVERQLQGVQGRLVAVEQHQLGGGVPMNLPAELRPDRAAGAGDQHALSGQVTRDGVQVGLDLRPAEQVGDPHVLTVGDPHPAGFRLAAGRHGPEPGARTLGHGIPLKVRVAPDLEHRDVARRR
jgi:hypothetical protein